MVFVRQQVPGLFFEPEFTGNFDGLNQDWPSGSCREDFQNLLRDLWVTSNNSLERMNRHRAHEHLRVASAFTAFVFFCFRQRLQCGADEEIGSASVSGIA